jgi:glutamate formiminotransferase
VLECVVNVSEGRDPALVAELAAAGSRFVLDVHADADHNRSVLTVGGRVSEVEEAVRALAGAAVERLDLRAHTGAHPRIGTLDVVPFVALEPDAVTGRLADGPIEAALSARDGFARWAGDQLGLPCFLYGPERSLPEVRRTAWTSLPPDFGPSAPHPTAGAAAVGARPALVAYNLWLDPGAGLALARQVAAAIRGPAIRALGLPVGGTAQVSCNLVDPWRLGPGAAFDLVVRALHASGWPLRGTLRSELVGLLPQAVLDAEASGRWAELGLSPTDTIEARLGRAGLDGGSFLHPRP